MRARGFTLVELVIVILLVAILAFAAMPRSGTQTITVGAQASQLAAAIRYAQTLSMTRGQRYEINFAANSYQITDANGVPVPDPATNSTAPTTLGPTTLTYSNNVIIFDGQGAPYSAPTTPLAAPATVTLSQAGQSDTLTISPQTGRVAGP